MAPIKDGMSAGPAALAGGQRGRDRVEMATAGRACIILTVVILNMAAVCLIKRPRAKSLFNGAYVLED